MCVDFDDWFVLVTVVTLYLLYFLILVLIIFPIGVIAGLGYSVLNLFCAAFKQFRSNLKFRNLPSSEKKNEDPAYLMYVFGPAQRQLKKIRIGCFNDCVEIRSDGSEKGAEMWSDGIDDFRTDHLLGGIKAAFGGGFFLNVNITFAIVLVPLVLVGYGLSWLIVGLVWLVIAGIAGAVRLVDMAFLFINRIFADCPVHKQRYLIPAFICPSCGKVHKKLVPGRYGIFHHRCECGKRIASTLMAGRNKLKPCCPVCSCPIISASSRPNYFQLIGGSAAGKSVYLAAFFHEFLAMVDSFSHLEAKIPDSFDADFKQLEKWYQGGEAPATTSMDAKIYPVMLRGPGFRIDRLFGIYDISGEMFEGSTASRMVTTEQMRNCGGILFVLDPFSHGKLRETRLQNGQSLDGISKLDPEVVAINFIHQMTNGAMKITRKKNTPVSILIVKADEPEIKPWLSPAKVKAYLKDNADKCQTLQDARDQLCIEFLEQHRLMAAPRQLSAVFSKLHFFPVSAMGHSKDGTPFEPWGVMESMQWMIQESDSTLAKELGITDEKT